MILDLAHTEHGVISQPRTQAFDQSRQCVGVARALHRNPLPGTGRGSEIAEAVSRQHLLEQRPGTHSDRDHRCRQCQRGQPFGEQPAQVFDVAARRCEPDAKARHRMRAMLEVQGEHRDGGLPSTQECLQARHERLARELEPCCSLDLVLENTPFGEMFRAAKSVSHIRAPAQRTIELVEPRLAQPPHHTTPRQPQQIPDGTQSHAVQLLEQLLGPAQMTQRNRGEALGQRFGPADQDSAPSPACGRAPG